MLNQPKNKENLFLCFIDFKKAFDTIWRPGLHFKLFKSGLSSNTVLLIKDMYDKLYGYVKCGPYISNSFPIQIGSRHGCPLSPTLFNLFINDLPIFLESCNCNPVYLNGVPINILMYADDVTLISYTKNGLQKSLNAIDIYAKKWNLIINVKKTKVIIFNSRRKINQNFMLSNNIIQNCSSFCYLGIIINSKGSFKPGIKRLKDKASKAYVTWKQHFNNFNNASVFTLCKLFDSLCKPILLYGSEVWGAFCQR